MDPAIKKALQKAGDASILIQAKRVHGGSINDSYYIETEKRKYFIKYNKRSPERFFEMEAKGLEQIRKTDTIKVPDVLSFSDEESNGFLALEWIDGKKNDGTEKRLGEQLAAFHSTFGKKHGFEDDTFIGHLPQPNGLYISWLDYYRDKRLKAQVKLGIERNHIGGKRKKQLVKLVENLGNWIPNEVKPSYLHGDLWNGNWLVGPEGEPYVIDPSFLYGDRQFEIAFTELFGGYSRDFYDAYQASFPLSSDYGEIKSLYQLYYLLVHLNMFGEAYGPSVDAILNKYVP
ncbi:fructosamine kinase [Pueribacillus theae]|uniref:Fructosamine kinase n=1 Tax=Pueribacillus theae TaxID=2171751 RepID=A0A2U1K0G3_9BACI|nr:fructosamine kinase family protein [Pueribacillus theae]PWA10659.1 fructosamine kinase [Pueribacillus theae]